MKLSEFIRTNATTQIIARQLRPGKPVTARISEAGELQALYFPVTGKDSLIVVQRQGSKLSASEQPVSLETRTIMRSGEIRYSLFGATDTAGIPDTIAAQLAEILLGTSISTGICARGPFQHRHEMLFQQGSQFAAGASLPLNSLTTERLIRPSGTRPKTAGGLLHCRRKKFAQGLPPFPARIFSCHIGLHEQPLSPRAPDLACSQGCRLWRPGR